MVGSNSFSISNKNVWMRCACCLNFQAPRPKYCPILCGPPQFRLYGPQHTWPNKEHVSPHVRTDHSNQHKIQTIFEKWARPKICGGTMQQKRKTNGSWSHNAATYFIKHCSSLVSYVQFLKLSMAPFECSKICLYLPFSICL